MRLLSIWLTVSVPVLLMCGPAGESSRVKTYPAIAGLQQSDLYTVSVNDESVWTEKLRSRMEFDALPDWFKGEPYTRVQQEVHIANFSATGKLSVKIAMSVPFKKVILRPRNREIPVSVSGNTIRFNLSGPDKLYLEVDSLPPLLFFANPPEKEKVNADDPHVRYFGPGVHRPGMMTLQDEDIVYIAGGAIVYGGLSIKNAKHVRILGRGILDGDLKHRRMVWVEDSKDVDFSGILIRNGGGWTNTLVNSSDVSYRDIKVVSFCPGGDGINPLGSQNVIIDHCLSSPKSFVGDPFLLNKTHRLRVDLRLNISPKIMLQAEMTGEEKKCFVLIS